MDIVGMSLSLIQQNMILMTILSDNDLMSLPADVNRKHFLQEGPVPCAQLFSREKNSEQRRGLLRVY